MKATDHEINMKISRGASRDGGWLVVVLHVATDDRG